MRAQISVIRTVDNGASRRVGVFTFAGSNEIVPPGYMAIGDCSMRDYQILVYERNIVHFTKLNKKNTYYLRNEEIKQMII